MKKRLIIASATLSMALGMGAVLSQASPFMTFAAKDDTYYLIGDTNEIGWVTETTKIGIVDGGDAVPIAFAKDDQFKFIKNQSWDEQINVSTSSGGTARNLFVDGGEGNFKCNVAGTYNVKIEGGEIFFDLLSYSTAKIYFQLQGWANTYVYMFDEDSEDFKYETLGSWPGTNSFSYTTATNFGGGNGGIGVIEVPYVNLSNTKIILNNGSNDQSPDYPLADNFFYWKHGGEGVGYLNDGKAAEIVYAFDAYYGATDGTCATPSSDAARLWNLYAEAEGNVKTKVDQSVITSSNLSVGTVAYELYKIAQKAGETVTPPSSLYDSALETSSNTNNSSLTFIVTLSITSIAAIGGYFFLRRRKEN